jgi:density-regulated protein DRP1
MLGLELKKITKMFANKFACGSSVVKSASNEDEVVIQGEVLEDVKDFLIQEFPDLVCFVVGSRHMCIVIDGFCLSFCDTLVS